MNLRSSDNTISDHSSTRKRLASADPPPKQTNKRKKGQGNIEKVNSMEKTSKDDNTTHPMTDFKEEAENANSKNTRSIGSSTVTSDSKQKSQSYLMLTGLETNKRQNGQGNIEKVTSTEKTSNNDNTTHPMTDFKEKAENANSKNTRSKGSSTVTSDSKQKLTGLADPSPKQTNKRQKGQGNIEKVTSTDKTSKDDNTTHPMTDFKEEAENANSKNKRSIASSTATSDSKQNSQSYLKLTGEADPSPKQTNKRQKGQGNIEKVTSTDKTSKDDNTTHPMTDFKEEAENANSKNKRSIASSTATSDSKQNSQSYLKLTGEGSCQGIVPSKLRRAAGISRRKLEQTKTWSREPKQLSIDDNMDGIGKPVIFAPPPPPEPPNPDI